MIKLETLEATYEYPTEQDFREYSPRYQAALKACMPTRPPQFRPGDWIYDGLHEMNMPVVHVAWDDFPMQGSRWIVSTWGHGAPQDHFSPEREGAPYGIFEVEKCGHSARLVEKSPTRPVATMGVL